MEKYRKTWRPTRTRTNSAVTCTPDQPHVLDTLDL